MGMYTALSLGVELDIPQNGSVAKILSYMLSGDDERPVLSDDEKDEADFFHPFFSTDRWHWMLRCDSYYFDYDSGFTLRWDNISNNYYLSGVCNLKNYSREIEEFLDWLMPFIHPSVSFMGWKMYEEQWMPTILMRRQLTREDDPSLVEINVEKLVAQVGVAGELIEMLMAGAGNCVVDIGKLNDWLIEEAKLKKEVS